MDTIAPLSVEEQTQSAIGCWMSRQTEADTDGLLRTRLPMAMLNKRAKDKDAPLPRSQATLVALDDASPLGMLFMGDGTATLAWSADGSALSAAIAAARQGRPWDSTQTPRLLCSPAPFRLLGVHAVQAIRPSSTKIHTRCKPHEHRHSLRWAIDGPQQRHPRLVVDAHGKASIWDPTSSTSLGTTTRPVAEASTHPLALWWARFQQDAKRLFADASTHARVADLPYAGRPLPAWKGVALPRITLQQPTDFDGDLTRILAAWPQAAQGADRLQARALICGVAVFPDGTAHRFPIGIRIEGDPAIRPLHAAETRALLALLGWPDTGQEPVWTTGWSQWEGHAYRASLSRLCTCHTDLPTPTGHAALAIAARGAAFA